MSHETVKEKQRERFKTTDLKNARARVIERAPHIDPEFLAGVIYTLDEKPRPQKLTRKQCAYGERLAELRSRAEAEGPITAGPIVGAWLDYFNELPNALNLRQLEVILARVPNRPENAKLLRALESMRQRESEHDYRALYRADQEKIAFEEGDRAGAFAYGYRYDPLRDERRGHMCLQGNFVAEWQIRASLKRWLGGYRKGWRAACSADDAKKVPRGVDPARPQPLPEMNTWLQEALATHVRSARAAAAKYSRSDNVKKNELRKQLRERYERGEILGPTRSVYRKDIAAQTFFDGLPEEDKRLWSRLGDSEEKRDWRGINDLQKALTGAKRPCRSRR